MKPTNRIISFAVLLSVACLCQAQSVASADDMKQARRGNVEAMHSLALSYKDAGMTDSAFYWAEKAANKGYMFSQSVMGELYERQTPPDYKKAAFWYEKAARKGYNWAQYRLGHFYSSGLGVEANDKQAEQWLKKAAEAGACWGLPQYEYGRLYAKGMEAKKWLLESAALGCDQALFELGMKYSAGSISGFEINQDSAFYYYEKAAQKGIADAKFFLSQCYAYGRGCKQSYYNATIWYRSAEKGDSYYQSLNKMGNNTPEKTSPYMAGESGIKLKDNPAECWFLDLVYNQNDVAFYLLFSSYFYGRFGVEKNRDEAITWLHAAAAADYKEAHYYLGLRYEGQGDTAKALSEYKKSLASNRYAVGYTTEPELENIREQCMKKVEALSANE